MVDFIKNTRNVLFALLLLSSVAGAASASTSVAAGIHIGPSGRASVDLGFFYDSLAPYGNWIERPSYGWVWTPTTVSTSWRPYEYGHWVWTDEGWVWVTDEPYGWATYHYGRWYDDPEIGWAWVPGDEWGPAWVSWQEGADYVGWAPLPPGVSVSVGLGGGYGGYAYGIAPEDYVFVPERDFLAPRIATYIVPTTRVRGFWGQTRNYTNYRFGGGRVFNQGVPVNRFERFGRRVPRYQVADLGGTDFRRYRGGARIQGNRLAIFRPQVHKAARVTPPIQRAAARRAVVSAARFKAAHPQRVARAQQLNRLARQDRQQVRQQRAETRGGAPALNPRGKALQRQARVDQRQAQAARQRAVVQQRQAQASRQRAATQQRQAQVARQKAATQQRQAQVARQRAADQHRQTQASRQRVATQQRQAQVARQRATVQKRQAQASRQRAVAQQRQAQASRQRAAAQQRQAQSSRQRAVAQRQAARQQRPPQRQAQGGGGRGHGQGGGQGGHQGHRGHRPPGR